MKSSEKQAITKSLCEEDFYFFCRYFFQKREGTKWSQNWHHEELTDTLTAISKYKIGCTVFNIPPRYSKTEIVVIMFIAWCLANNPKAKFIHLSYSDDLALDNSSKIKELIESDEYQEFWKLTLKRDSKSKKKWYTEQGGGVYAGAAGGAVRGFGAGSLDDGLGKPFGGAIIIDDPLKADKEYISPLEIDDCNSRLNVTVSNRRNSHEFTPIIIIMQRVHMNDMSGFVLANGMNEHFHHVNLPAIMPDGTALWQAKHTVEQLEAMRKANPYVFAGQYMQNPIPMGGAMFKREWLKHYDVLEARGMNVAILVDPADSKAKTADYTCFIVVALGADRNYYVLDIVRDRLNLKERTETLFRLHRKWRPQYVGYEKIGMQADIQHIEDKQETINYRFHIEPLNDGGSRVPKENRIERLVPLFAEKRIWLPKQGFMYTDVNGAMTDLVRSFIEEEYLAYPVSKHDDVIDCLSKILDPDFYLDFPVDEISGYDKLEEEAETGSWMAN